MTEYPRNAPCPCGSGLKFKQCHGSSHPPSTPLGGSGQPSEPGQANVENPFKRIFNDDGQVNQEYVLTRLRHLEEIMQKEPKLLGLRYDREELERLLGVHEQVFQEASESGEFENIFRRFAELALPELVSEEFDEKAKEVLRNTVQDQELTRRDRAACACGLILTLPAEGEAAQPHHENPFFDLVLRVTYNETVARAEFLSQLDQEENLSEMEREARIQEFLRSVPALLHELQEGFRLMMERALSSYEQGDYSFGMGLDMLLHGVRAVRQLTHEFEEDEGEAYTDHQREEFQEKFGTAINDAFAEDIGEEEEDEIMVRMAGFLEDARAAKRKPAAKGLAAALSLMYQNPEVKHRLLLAAYHESVTGKRIFAEPDEEKVAVKLYEQPFDAEPYLELAELLRSMDQGVRAERVLRNAMEFFPEDEEVRERLVDVADALAPEREARVRQEIADREATAEEE
ncbi:MAG: SEC-C domain-containing protein [Planctomycetota bacterium]